MRKYFAEQSHNPARQTMAETLEQADKNLSRMPYQYRRMVEASREAAAVDSDSIMPRAPFKPFLEDELRPAAIRAAKASSGDLLAEMHSARWDAEDDCKPTGTAKEPSSPLSVIDCHDTTALDVAYHSIKADREMWPAEV